MTLSRVQQDNIFKMGQKEEFTALVCPKPLKEWNVVPGSALCQYSFKGWGVGSSHQGEIRKLHGIKWFWRRWDPDCLLFVHVHPHDRNVVMNHLELGITKMSRADEEYPRNHRKYL